MRKPMSPEHKREAIVVYNNLYRAKSLGLPATLTLKQWLATLDHFNWKCAYCQGPYEALDHFEPMSMGEKGTTADNCVPAYKVCNMKKFGDTPKNMIRCDIQSPGRFIPARAIRSVRIYLRKIKSTQISLENT